MKKLKLVIFLLCTISLACMQYDIRTVEYDGYVYYIDTHEPAAGVWVQAHALSKIVQAETDNEGYFKIQLKDVECGVDSVVFRCGIAYDSYSDVCDVPKLELYTGRRFEYTGYIYSKSNSAALSWILVELYINNELYSASYTNIEGRFILYSEGTCAADSKIVIKGGDLFQDQTFEFHGTDSGIEPAEACNPPELQVYLEDAV